MEVRFGYKQTEAGAIPGDWRVATLGDEGECLIGLTYRPEEVSLNGTLVLRASNIQDSALRFDDNVHVTTKVPDRLMVRLGDILLCVRNGSRELIGKSALIDSSALGMTFGAFMAVYRTARGPLLHQIFQTSYFKRQIDSHLGATINQITNKSLKGFRVALPGTPAEGDAIAGALSDVDALLGALDAALSKKRDLRQAAMQQLLTGQTRLPGFRADWATWRIGDIASPLSERNLAGEELPVLACSKHVGFVDSLGFFKNRVFSDDLSAYRVIRRGQIGYPANHVEEGSIGLQTLYDVALVSPIYVVFAVVGWVNSYFLHRLLKLDSFRRVFKIATTSSVDRRGSLRWPAFSEIEVRLPESTEQSAIAQVLTDMDAEIEVLEARRDKTRLLKQAMIQELLTGRTRLV